MIVSLASSVIKKNHDKMTNLLYLTCMLLQPQKTRLLSLRNHAKSLVRNYAVRRCILEVPTSNTRKLDHALQLNVDSLCFSLFDDPLNEFKDNGRNVLSKILNEKNNPQNLTEWCVKVHPVQFKEDFLLDIDAILSTRNLPKAILLPHLNSCEQFNWFLTEICRRIMIRDREDRGPVQLLLEINSPKGIMRLEELCKAAQEMTSSTPFQLSALIYGYDELKKHLGTVRTPGGLECIYSRQKLVLVAKAFGLQAIDLPHKNKNAGREFTSECEDGMALGFTGKMVIFPEHVTTTQSVFSPSRQRVKESRHIAYNIAQYKDLKQSSDIQYNSTADPDELATAKYVIEVAEISNKYKA